MCKIHSFLIVVLLLIFVGCAQVRSISGGEKDTQPPVLLGAQPANTTLRFHSNQFTLFFDEYVQLRDIQKELLVSPPLKQPPKVQVKQRSVVVSWDDTLRKETTYLFQFGKAIADLNESNALNDVTYVFSTGDLLDSLYCCGRVMDAFAGKPASAMKVLLFDSLATLFSSDARPAYCTRTDESGHFCFQYLRKGSYVLSVLSDENNNNRFDMGEGIDWMENVSPAQSSDSTVNLLYLSVPRDTIIRGFDYKTDNLGVLRFFVEPWQEQLRVQSLSNDTIVQWMRDDTLHAVVHSACSGSKSVRIVAGSQIIDTLELNRQEAPAFQLSHAIKPKVALEEPIELFSSRPVNRRDDSRLQVVCDSVALMFDSEMQGPAGVRIGFEKKPGKTYRVTVLPGFITDDCGATNDTLKISFSVYEAKELGSLRVKVPTELVQNPHTFRLLDRSRKEVYRLSKITSQEWLIDELLPGDYTAVVGNDTNGNGRIDPIVLFPKVQTELNRMFPGPIQVRANWEVVVEWSEESP